MPSSTAHGLVMPCCAAYSRTSCVIFIEQNFGPHMEQKCATLLLSLGRVSSWNSRAVSGSRPRLNWSCQRNSKRALRERVVARPRTGMPLGDVGRMRRDLVRDDALLHVVAVRQAQVLLGRDVAQHRGAGPADHRGADGAGDVVVARRDVDGQRAERVERRLVAVLELLVHVGLDQVHRHVARAFDHGLHVVLPGDLRAARPACAARRTAPRRWHRTRSRGAGRRRARSSRRTPS